MDVNKILTIIFSGLGTGLILWGLTYIYSGTPTPTYCEEIYQKEHLNLKALKKYLLSESKKKLLINKFKKKIDRVSQGNKYLKDSIIKSSANYIGSEPIYFNHKSELGKSCVHIDSSDYMGLFEDHLFSKKEIKGKKIIKNNKSIEQEKVGSFLTEYVKGLKIDIIKNEYKKINDSESNSSVLDLLIHDFDYKIKKDNYGSEYYVYYTGHIYPSAILSLHNPIEKKLIGSDDNTYKVKEEIGFDNNKKYAYFDIIYLSKNYNWKLGSVDKIEEVIGKKHIIKNISKELGGLGIKKYISNSGVRSIIAIGTASCEGELEREEERAELRTLQMAYWFNENYKNLNTKNGLSFNLLNLGKYQKSACQNKKTDHQRKFVIIGVTDYEAGVDIEEALKDVLKRSDSPLDINNYSNFNYTEKYNFNSMKFNKAKIDFYKGN